MHIIELTLQTAQLETQRAFYEQLFGLHPIKASPTAFTVQAGQTQLTFQSTQQTGLTYHFAFTIPVHKFIAARELLKVKDIKLLNEDTWHHPSTNSWHSHSLYFHDPDHSILEFIIHHDLPDPPIGDEKRDQEYHVDDILRVSEIGLVVDDVSAVANQLHQQYQFEPYRGSSSSNFAAIGDTFGLFIIVEKGRPWHPTTNEHAVVAPVEVSITGTPERSYEIPSFPFIIHTIAPVPMLHIPHHH